MARRLYRRAWRLAPLLAALRGLRARRPRRAIHRALGRGRARRRP